MYDPNVGRFLEEDPIGFDAGDADLYRYGGNDPTNEVDPSGEDAWFLPRTIWKRGVSVITGEAPPPEWQFLLMTVGGLNPNCTFRDFLTVGPDRLIRGGDS